MVRGAGDEDSCTLDPYFVTGFADGEGTFSVSISPTRLKKNSKFKTGWTSRVAPVFKISLHIRDLSLLKRYPKFLGGVGSISVSETSDVVQY
jgi:hypothetical protein